MSKFFLSCLLVGSALLASAVGPRVAIVAAATNTANEQTNTRFTDPRDMLVADGRFASVTIISTTPYGGGFTPTLFDLLNYDAILHWTNDSNANSVGLGNGFADYVDAGGGVVVSVFANTSLNVNRYLGGRWLTGGYEIIPSAGGHTEAITGGTATEGFVHMAAPLVPSHPIFTGVGDVRLIWKTTTQGLRWGAHRPSSTNLKSWATKLALWDDGRTAVAAHNSFPNRIDLGMHPVSDLVAAAYYDHTSDGGKLIANALLYSAGAALDTSLTLNDTVTPFASPRTISYAVKQGLATLKTGTVSVGARPAAPTIYVRRSATGPATIEFDGSSFLKRVVAVTLTGNDIDLGPISMTNGDVDNSGEVDAADIDAVIAAFGSTTTGITDVDVTGEVDAADIDIVIANFGSVDD